MFKKIFEFFKRIFRPSLLEFLDDYLLEAIHVVELLKRPDLSGEEKRHSAVHAVTIRLRQKGIKVPEHYINLLVETAVAVVKSRS